MILTLVHKSNIIPDSNLETHSFARDGWLSKAFYKLTEW